jgi:hypothetical protein
MELDCLMGRCHLIVRLSVAIAVRDLVVPRVSVADKIFDYNCAFKGHSLHGINQSPGRHHRLRWSAPGGKSGKNSFFPEWYNRAINRKQVKMTTLDFKLSLSDQLRKEAEAAGLLSPKAIERLLREEIRRRRVDNLFAVADRLAALDLPVLTDDEIMQEIRMARN